MAQAQELATTDRSDLTLPTTAQPQIERVRVRPGFEQRRVAFWERHPDHEGGEAMIIGGDEPKTIARTRAAQEAILQRRLVEVGVVEPGEVQTQTPSTTPQTPPTRTGGTAGGSGKEQPPPANKQTGDSPFTGLGLTPEQERALMEGGYSDRHALQDAPDDALLALPTIGKATVANLRKALGETA